MSLVAALDYPLDLAPTTALKPRLRVVLLGCGTVNSGVLAGLEDMPGQVEIAAIVTRRPRNESEGAYAWLTDLTAAFDTGPDLVIDALPDCAAAEKALALAVERGVHVISANKAVIARRPDLEAKARRAGLAFAYSAAVGAAFRCWKRWHVSKPPARRSPGYAACSTAPQFRPRPAGKRNWIRRRHRRRPSRRICRRRPQR